MLRTALGESTASLDSTGRSAQRPLSSGGAQGSPPRPSLLGGRALSLRLRLGCLPVRSESGQSALLGPVAVLAPLAGAR